MPDTGATPSATVPCEHDEPRGCAACALCRRRPCRQCAPPVGADEMVQPFTTRVPVKLYAAVKAKAKAEDRKVAQVVRVLLRDYVGW